MKLEQILCPDVSLMYHLYNNSSMEVVSQDFPILKEAVETDKDWQIHILVKFFCFGGY
jgi:hypothetical protein